MLLVVVVLLLLLVFVFFVVASKGPSTGDSCGRGFVWQFRTQFVWRSSVSQLETTRGASIPSTGTKNNQCGTCRCAGWMFLGRKISSWHLVRNSGVM